MDILKYGADVEVLAPESLRQLVREEHERAAKSYLASDKQRFFFNQALAGSLQPSVSGRCPTLTKIRQPSRLNG